MEKLLPTAEEKERMEEGDTEEENGDTDTDEEKEAVDKTEEDVLSSAQPKDKKQADVLNLNNEVVKMRKEVKRVRALIIRKLTRHISGLKKKKGKEMEIERNQRRAARLLEEIHAMKVLSPDMVTKKALQKNLKFEEVCKNLKSTISDRAIARIATHPSFNKKIEVIRAAVKAFKEERMRGGEQNMEKMQNEAGEVTAQSPDTVEERGSVEGEEDLTEQLKETLDKEGAGSFKDAKDSTDVKAETDTGKAALSVHTADVLNKELKSVTQAPTESIKVKDIVKSEPHSKDIGKKASPTVLQKKEESDLESSDDEEKEYFDDSTEERFHRQSSQSEESDDDFFVGKVSKFKRKQKNLKGEIRVEKDHEVKGDSADKVKTSDKVQGEPDELESRLKSKPTSLQTVFCSSLSCSKQSGNVGRGRGGNASRGQRKPKSGSGLKHFDKKSKDTGPERNSEFKYNSKRAEVEEKGFASGVRGRQQGRGNVIRQKSHMGGGVFSHQAPQQALHPSWEASKKRKEQQGQLLAFQGKKIKFDD